MPYLSGLNAAFEIVFDPVAGFAKLKHRPTWLVAFALVVIFLGVGTALRFNAERTVLTALFEQHVANTPSIHDRLTPAQQGDLERRITIVTVTGFLIGNIINVAAYWLALVIVTAVVARRLAAREIWAVVVNASIVGVGLSAVVRGAIIVLRGPTAFRSLADLQATLPSAAWLVPLSPSHFTAFLAAFQPFTIWMIVLFGYGLVVLLGLPPRTAYLCACAAYAIVIVVPLLLLR